MKCNSVCFLCLLVHLFFSCANVKKENDGREQASLVAVDEYLSFKIDEDTRLPKFCLWIFEENGKEYIAFPNMGREILFYDIESQEMIKRVKYEKEGNNGVGDVLCFYPVDFNHIYLFDLNMPRFFVTDTTGTVSSKFDYGKEDNVALLTPAMVYTITYNPMCLVGQDSIYLPQIEIVKSDDEGNEKSPLGIMINKNTHQITSTPLKYSSNLNKKDRMFATAGLGKVSVCFDGKQFVYSDEMRDSIYKLSSDFSKSSGYLATSRYIKSAKYEIIRDSDIDKMLKRTCELPTYGNIIYDKYRQVYYRFAFPEVEMEEERDYLGIYHNGRKQFSIIILDKDMNIIGETLFPEYTYNPYLLFIRKDGLYMSTSHFKRTDFDENVLRFRKIELKL